jgi:hypothetical protein
MTVFLLKSFFFCFFFFLLEPLKIGREVFDAAQKKTRDIVE